MIELPTIEKPTFDTSENAPVKQALDRFHELHTSEAQLPTQFEMPDCDDACIEAPTDDNGGDIVGKDLVMAINDELTEDTTALLRFPAPTGDADPAPQPEPNIPEPPAVGSTEAASAQRAHALGLNGTPSEVLPTGKKAQRVKLFVTFKNYQTQCSGTLVDSQWVVTAAHCVFDESRQYAKSVAVVPGFGRAPDLEPFGRAYSSQILIREKFWQSLDVNQDIAWVKLARPIGGFVGYHQMKRADCDAFTDQTHVHNAYPVDNLNRIPDTPSNNGKRMYEFKFHFEKCTLGGNNKMKSAGWAASGGQSGGGMVLPAPGSGFGGTLTGVMAQTGVGIPFFQSHVLFIRLSKGALQSISSSINASTPATADLAPAAVRVTNASTQPGQVQSLSTGAEAHLTMWLHNLSPKSFSGKVTYTAYVSRNKNITSLDHPFASFQTTTTLGGKQTMALSKPIKIPCRPQGATASDEVYLGVIVNNTDANTSNNDSSSFSMPVRIQGNSVCF